MVYQQRDFHSAPPTYYGTTQDIGLSGLSLIVDRNIFDDGKVTVLIALPAAEEGAPPKIITALAEMTYAIHSSKLDAFKVGMAFREFKGDGQELLRAALLHEQEQVLIAETEDPYAGPGAAASFL